MEKITLINYGISIVFAACFFYQFVYIGISLVRRRGHKLPDAPPLPFAVLVCARNEEAVIGGLLASIRAQKYPSELLDIYVVADNCTDHTAQVARSMGAIVLERFDRERVGKGYALAYVLDHILAKEPNRYAGYFVFDADNVLDEHYVEEMNKTFFAGNRIVTSYRNSKNYASSWISAGYSLWFLHEARHLNHPRMLLGTSCAVSGTGFLIHRDIVAKNNGWKHFLLTEDIEFTVDSILQGERIGYCDSAVLYDEQPVKLTASWNQRVRWTKGILQVQRRYGAALAKGMMRGSFACFDMLMILLPPVVLMFIGLLANIGTLALSALLMKATTLTVVSSVLEMLSKAYLMFFAMGALTCLTEWKNIHCSVPRKLLSLVTFPLYMFTYIPISFAALFLKAEWKPVRHCIVRTPEEIRSGRL